MVQRCMNIIELRSILKSINEAIAVFTLHQGTMVFREVNVKSMLTVLKDQITDQLDVGLSVTSRAWVAQQF